LRKWEQNSFCEKPEDGVVYAVDDKIGFAFRKFEVFIREEFAGVRWMNDKVIMHCIYSLKKLLDLAIASLQSLRCPALFSRFIIDGRPGILFLDKNLVAKRVDSIVLPYEDLTWFIDRFQQLGEPIGIKLNLQKTQLLTTLTDQSPLPHLSLSQQQHLLNTLHKLGPNAEQRNGIRLLGQPIGSTAFALDYINQKVHHLETFTSTKLFYRLHDHQTQLALLKHCIVPSIQHLLATHVYHTYSALSTNDLHQWHTETTTRLRTIIHNVFAQITKQQTLPTHAFPPSYTYPRHLAESVSVIPSPPLSRPPLLLSLDPCATLTSVSPREKTTSPHYQYTSIAFKLPIIRKSSSISVTHC
jgi:hypothetical protein